MQLVLYNTGEKFIFLTKVYSIRIGDKDSFIPEDASAFFPKEYADVPAATWFPLPSLEKIEESDLKGLRVAGEENTTVIDEIRCGGRFPGIHFTTD